MNRLEPTLKAGTRIQRKNRKTILDAALEVFSVHGLRGTTMDELAERAGMSKPNLLYYFAGKDAIYVAVLEEILAEWLQPLANLDPEGDPISEIARYIDAKLAFSRTRPAASRLFANEILGGAAEISGFLGGPLKSLVAEKAAVISRWIEEGRLARVDPVHLIFMIWAVTQHYADFDVQIRAVLDNETNGDDVTAAAGATIATVLFDGLRPRHS